MVSDLCDQGGFTSLEAFDDAFRGTQAVFNWVQDFEAELFTAGHRDRRYYEHRVRYCEDFLKRFAATDELMRENMRRAVAKSWARLGQHARSVALFEQWLKDDPQWGWGWIGWSDTYSFTQETERDLRRAEALLKRGLEVPGVRDREHILERLRDLSEEPGSSAETDALSQGFSTMATSVERVGDRQVSINSKLDFGEEGLPLDQLGQVISQLRGTPPHDLAALPGPKTGRNDPCPCGSGKKYKKCCGKD